MTNVEAFQQSGCPVDSKRLNARVLQLQARELPPARFSLCSKSVTFSLPKFEPETVLALRLILWIVFGMHGTCTQQSTGSLLFSDSNVC